MANDKITSIGCCPCCRRSSVLKDGACKACSERFGPGFARLASKVRESPAFKKKCYDALSTVAAREAFLSTFGPVDEVYAIGSVNPRQGSL